MFSNFLDYSYVLCVCTKRVSVCDTELVCKAVRLAFSCQTSVISLPFIPIPWHTTDESKSLHGQSEPVQAQYYPSHTIASVQDSHSAKQSRVKTQVQNKVHSAKLNQPEKYGRWGRLI